VPLFEIESNDTKSHGPGVRSSPAFAGCRLADCGTIHGAKHFRLTHNFGEIPSAAAYSYHVLLKGDIQNTCSALPIPEGLPPSLVQLRAAELTRHS
jgi:hypothetical protein